VIEAKAMNQKKHFYFFGVFCVIFFVSFVLSWLITPHYQVVPEPAAGKTSSEAAVPEPAPPAKTDTVVPESSAETLPTQAVPELPTTVVAPIPEITKVSTDTISPIQEPPKTSSENTKKVQPLSPVAAAISNNLKQEVPRITPSDKMAQPEPRGTISIPRPIKPLYPLPDMAVLIEAVDPASTTFQKGVQQPVPASKEITLPNLKLFQLNQLNDSLLLSQHPQEEEQAFDLNQALLELREEKERIDISLMTPKSVLQQPRLRLDDHLQWQFDWDSALLKQEGIKIYSTHSSPESSQQSKKLWSELNNDLSHLQEQGAKKIMAVMEENSPRLILPKPKFPMIISPIDDENHKEQKKMGLGLLLLKPPSIKTEHVEMGWVKVSYQMLYLEQQIENFPISLGEPSN